MGMVVVILHIIFAEVNSRFRTGCRTRLSHYLQSSLLTLDAPRVLSLPKLHPSMFVLVKCRNAPEREALVAVLEKDNSNVGEHLSVIKVGPSNEPVFST